MLDKAAISETSPASRARALAPDIEAAADETERSGQAPAQLMEKLHAAGLFRLLLPRSVGGEECDLAAYTHTLEEVGKADASIAWCIGQGCGVSFASAYLATDVARQIFGRPDAIIASGPSTPKARAVVADGGYVVSGEWTFASGSRHAQWLGAHCPVFEADGTPRRPEQGPAEITAVFPKENAQIADVWRVMGLAGTGSDDYSVRELFVPAAFTFTRDRPADRRENGPLYKFSNFNIFGLAFAGISLGLARRMHGDFIALARTKRPSHAGQPLADNNSVQRDIGMNEAKLQAARAYLYSEIAAHWDRVAAGAEFSARDRIALRMTSTYVIQSAKEVADCAYHAAGATAIFRNKPFERRFRDMHVLTQQGQSHLSNFEVAGKMIVEG